MRRLFFYGLMALQVIFLACGDEKSAGEQAGLPEGVATDTSRFTTVQWIDSVKDIGQLKMGDTATIDFRFKNTGNYPLFIISAEPGCGCTVADYPRGAISPGGDGVITAQFDTNRGAVGEFRKNLHVTTNTSNGTNAILYFMGTITQPGTPATDTLSNRRDRVLPRPDLLKKKLKIS